MTSWGAYYVSPRGAQWCVYRWRDESRGMAWKVSAHDTQAEAKREARRLNGLGKTKQL